jgi:hypothetical protein
MYRSQDDLFARQIRRTDCANFACYDVIPYLRLPDYLGGSGWILSDLSSTASKALANSRRLGGGVPVVSDNPKLSGA